MTITEDFWSFFDANPHIMERIEALAKEWYDATGGSRCSVDMLFHVMRFQEGVRTRDPNSSFKLNNNYTSRYIRVLLREHPEYEEMFETRRLKSA